MYNNNHSNVFAPQLGTHAPSAVTQAAAAASAVPIDNLNRDPNPVVVRKKQAPVQYTQNIAVRFLKPPPLPPQGRVIIKQEPDIILPPPPPLVIRKYHRLAKVSSNAAPTHPLVNVGQQAAFAGQVGIGGAAPFLDHQNGGFSGFSAPHASPLGSHGGLNLPPTSNFSFNYSTNGLENLSQGGAVPFNF
jgi:hypothetical protein